MERRKKRSTFGPFGKTFDGSYYEIGHQQGLLYKKNGLRVFDKVSVDWSLFSKQLKVYKEYYPELLEEFEGIADGMGYDFNEIASKFITTELLRFTDYLKRTSCTIFSVRKDNGSTFVGRNYDGEPVVRRVFSVYKVANNKANDFISITDMAVIGAPSATPRYAFYLPNDFINEKGLFIGMTIAYSNGWSYGLSPIHMSKLIAEKCGSVSDALNLYKRIPICRAKNFFIADKEGNSAVVEHSGKKFSIIKSESGKLIKTNHYLSPELSKIDMIKRSAPNSTSFLRYYEMEKELGSKGVKFIQQDVIKALNRKGSYVLQDKKRHGTDCSTVWSLSLNMKKMNYYLYYDVFGKRKMLKIGV